MTATLTATCETDPGGRRPRVLCALGDSASAGVGDRVALSGPVLRDALGGGWPVHLAALLGVEVVNLGSNGARARDVVQKQLRGALASRPDLATVLIGGNDVLRGDFDVDEVRAAVAETVATLLVSGAEVVLVLPPQIAVGFPAPPAVRRVLERRMVQVRIAIAELADELAQPRLLLVDADPLHTHGPDVMHIDRIHPSPRGHRLLAAHVGDELRARGWEPRGAVQDPPPPPGVVLQAAWLLVRGLPWLARRSRDLLPELVRVVVVEERRRRRRSRRLAQLGAPETVAAWTRVAAGGGAATGQGRPSSAR